MIMMATFSHHHQHHHCMMVFVSLSFYLCRDDSLQQDNTLEMKLYLRPPFLSLVLRNPATACENY